MAKAITKAASKAAAKGESEDDDVELSPEELGFAGHSEDAFAALKAKMADAQGKKSKKKDKKEAAAAAAAAASATPAVAAAAPMPATAVADSAAVAVPSADAETGESLIDTGVLVSCTLLPPCRCRAAFVWPAVMSRCISDLRVYLVCILQEICW